MKNEIKSAFIGVKTKLLVLMFALCATTALWAQNNVIIYTATEDLSYRGSHLYIGATTFGPAITSHTFSNGTGTITCSGEITTIGDEAFYYCTGLTSVTIPNSVTTIGDEAFDGCSGLTSVTIPNSVTTIGDEAFDGCSGLTSVTIGNSVTTIGRSAFDGCYSLTKTNYTGTIADWCKIKFGSYDANPMYYSHNFYINDVEVKDLVIPDGVDTIGSYAFEYCSGLTSVTIPSSVTTIGYNAFSGCSGLTSVTIPNSVTTIGEWAFFGCSGLTKTNYTGTIADWCKIKFDGYGYANPMYYTHNFYINDVEVKDLVIPEGVDTIGSYAFDGCSSLTSITIPSSVTTIGSFAFRDCSGLTSITIPSSVTTIGDVAFSGCSGLADIYCYAENPPSAGSEAFDYVSKHCYIHVPTGTIRDYQLAAEWNNFYHFFEISPLPSGSETDKVSVTVTNNYATFSWPVNPTASSYNLEITKDGKLFCTLIFNTLGQLVGMAFAPSRSQEDNPAAERTGYGYTFVVKNLDSNSNYAYTFTAQDSEGREIEKHQGTFDTTEPTAIRETHVSLSTIGKKFIRNGILYILRDGKTYDAQGLRVE